ncbi:MAG: SAM-dependent methyltransferase, partial [Gammaproteobacteria bacterium]
MTQKWDLLTTESLAEDSARFFGQLKIAGDIAAFIALNPAYTVAFDLSIPALDAYFRGRVWHDWLTIKEHLPACDALISLDIGSGVGGVNVAIGAHHDGEIDITAVDKARRQGFNVHQLAVDFATANLDAVTIRGLPPGDEAIGEKQYDLVTSFRGLCYMFPFSDYAQIIDRSLKPGGSMIVDVS